MADEARREMEADLQKVQDVFAQLLALAAVNLFRGETYWLEVYLLELVQKVVFRIEQLNADRDIH